MVGWVVKTLRTRRAAKVLDYAANTNLCFRLRRDESYGPELLLSQRARFSSALVTLVCPAVSQAPCSYRRSGDTAGLVYRQPYQEQESDISRWRKNPRLYR